MKIVPGETTYGECRSGGQSHPQGAPMSPEGEARLRKRASEIEQHLAKYPGSFPEAGQHAADILALLDHVAALRREVGGRRKQLDEVEQIAGKALGYPWFKVDQKNFPGATEETGVCIGEHVAETIVDELATKLSEARAQIAALDFRLNEERHD